jgi:hypothetical protein
MHKLWGFTNMALAYSTDPYGAGAASAYSDAASKAGVALRASASFPLGATDFTLQYRQLGRANARVIVLFAQAIDSARFMRMGLAEGIGGEGCEICTIRIVTAGFDHAVTPVPFAIVGLIAAMACLQICGWWVNRPQLLMSTGQGIPICSCAPAKACSR